MTSSSHYGIKVSTKMGLLPNDIIIGAQPLVWYCMQYHMMASLQFIASKFLAHFCLILNHISDTPRTKNYIKIEELF